MTKKATDQQVIEAITKHKGSLTKSAKSLGMNKSSLHNRLKKPEIQMSLQAINMMGLAKAGASLQKMYKRAAEGLDATRSIGFVKPKYVPDFKERRESVELCFRLIGRIEDKQNNNTPGPVTIIPVITINGKPLEYKIFDVPKHLMNGNTNGHANGHS